MDKRRVIDDHINLLGFQLLEGLLHDMRSEVGIKQIGFDCCTTDDALGQQLVQSPVGGDFVDGAGDDMPTDHVQDCGCPNAAPPFAMQYQF